MAKRTWALSGVAVLALTFSGTALAGTPDQAAAETVTWTASAGPLITAKPSSSLTLTLHAQVRNGWHVYALKQLPGGPTPLLVSLEPNKVAIAGGAPAGSPATKIHDAAFNLDTEFYSRAFTVSLPLRVAATPATGPQQLPVRVRFQTCNGQICQPPRTVHLSASVTVAQ
ncbi:MAG TPA: protein-disulfide reductase DsbD domain-containing protein [Rhizomicrobium sp.]|nr:protein-disulfide reductase DsbD domain-containing protein [Rhizomicrobium sp.]